MVRRWSVRIVLTVATTAGLVTAGSAAALGAAGAPVTGIRPVGGDSSRADSTTTRTVTLHATPTPAALGSPADLGRNAWTYVNSAAHTQSFYNSSGYAPVGYNAEAKPKYVARSYFQFVIPPELYGSAIIDARLRTTEMWSASSRQSWVDVNHVAGISSATTWDSQPARGTLIDRQYAVADWRRDHSYEPVAQNFMLTTELAAAAAGRWTTDTIGLYSESEADGGAFRLFGNDPVITVTFNQAPGTPTAYATSPATACDADGSQPYSVIGNTAVTLSATVADPDDSNVQGVFTLTDETSGSTVGTPSVTVTSGSTAAVQFSADAFTSGHSYGWNVRAYDGRSYSAPTPTCHFTVAKAAPGVPVVASTDYPAGAAGKQAGTPGTFTFTPPTGSEAPTSYVYALNNPPSTILPPEPGTYGNDVRIAAAPGGAPTSTVITPTRPGPNVLYVYAADAAGNISANATYSFSVRALSVSEASGDFTGDGIPDLLRVGPYDHPGLWLYAGTDKAGHVNPQPTQVGGSGTGFGAGTASGWTGATVSAADVHGDGKLDIVVKRPNGDPQTGNVSIYPGTGDGGTFDPTSRQDVQLDGVDGSGGVQTVDQVVAAPVSGLSNPCPDLYVVVGDTLYLYPAVFPPGVYGTPVALGTGWANRTASGTAVGTDPALFARDEITGGLDLYVGSAATGIPAGDPASARYAYAGSGFDVDAAPLIAGGDINVDGLPDLWTIGGADVVSAYLNDGNNGLNTAVVNAPTVWPAG